MNHSTKGYSKKSQQFLDSAIPYKKQYNAVTGSVLASILLQQIAYWDRTQGSQPFYKFIAPCSHKLYKEGESWQEELGFSKNEFMGAISRIATKIKKGVSKSEVLGALNAKSLIIYWTDASRVTWWQVNTALLNQVIEGILLDAIRADKYGNLITKPGFTLSNSENRIYLEDPKTGITLPKSENRNYLYSENTTENTTESMEQTDPESTPGTEKGIGSTDQKLEEDQKLDQELQRKNSFSVNQDPEPPKESSAKEKPPTGRERSAIEQTYAHVVSSASQSHTAASPVNVNKFVEFFNSNCGRWSRIPPCPPSRIVQGISGYRANFEGSDEDFYKFFQRLIELAQGSGKAFYKRATISQIFNPDGLPLTDFWADAYSVNTQQKQQREETKPIEVGNCFFDGLFGGQING